jgi:hypothetical protein
VSRRVDKRLIGEVAARLGEGGMSYSPRQLYYAVCAELEPPPTPKGTAQIGCGAFLFATGVIAGILASIYVGLLIIPGMVIFGMGVQRRRVERNRPTTRPLALGYEEFVAQLGDGAAAYPGLLDAFQPAAQDGEPPPADTVLLVCDNAESAAVLRANLPGRAVTVMVEADASPPPVLGQRVLVLHDADPSGCALALRLRSAGAVAVEDLGLRPAELVSRPVQVIEGAPRLVEPELARSLTADEVVWLANGRRVELAVLTPGELRDRVIAALQRSRDGYLDSGTGTGGDAAGASAHRSSMRP